MTKRNTNIKEAKLERISKMNEKLEKENGKLGWDIGCCGEIKCSHCQRIVYCAMLNIQTCPICLKYLCDWDWENNHQEHRKLVSETYKELLKSYIEKLKKLNMEVYLAGKLLKDSKRNSENKRFSEGRREFFKSCVKENEELLEKTSQDLADSERVLAHLEVYYNE